MNQLENRTVKEINLKDLYRVIKRRLWLVALIATLATTAGWFYSNLNKTAPIYQASSNIIIDADPAYKNTLQVIIKDITVIEKVIQELGIENSPETLAGQINVESIEDSQVVKISVTDTDPERAANIANTTARIFKGQIPKVMEFKSVSVLSEAKVNPFPINENNQNKIILGAMIIGIMIGIGLIFLIDSLDDSIKSEHDIESILGIPVLGSISKINKKNVTKRKIKSEKLELRGESIGLK
ncbi:capsular biosynthesis protein [Siminovitchia acidinfaciens]|uniref:Capsular biosynthesis protein n=1 Tax=Siminovitchia acidinfaciens TaxID=2321395 RepID=A0A429XW02_9BACI|nr:Wzz/FepE/Etk N-terminal domain-containing protein [Siminovitchia acidinfaciens]RST72540.1 capsular biosynthesis protein [Siminovitchia acidinfaciens]